MTVRTAVFTTSVCAILSGVVLSGAPSFAQVDPRAVRAQDAARVETDATVLQPQTDIVTQPGGDLSAVGTVTGSAQESPFRNRSLMEAVDIGSVTVLQQPTFEDIPDSILIAGGRNARIEDWPAIASFRGRAPSGWSIGGDVVHYCGGTAVEPEWVLTAAHCVTRLVGRADGSIGFQAYRPGSDGRVAHATFGPMEVVLSTDDLTDETRYVVRHVVAVYVHPGYVPASDGVEEPSNDIALVRLDDPWEGELMQLSTALDLDPPTLQIVEVAGFGALSGARSDKLRSFTRAPSGTDGHAGSPILQEAAVQIIDGAKCEEAYPGIEPASQVCAGYDEGGIDSCTGDSGGPLVALLEDGSRYQIGVVSFGRGCALAASYGVYTRVSRFAPWIAETIGSAPQLTIAASDP